jgi:hypothetical protein
MFVSRFTPLILSFSPRFAIAERIAAPSGECLLRKEARREPGTQDGLAPKGAGLLAPRLNCNTVNEPISLRRGLLMEIDDKVRKAWFDDFELKMKKEKSTDVNIDYNQVSLTFPNGPHPDYYGVFSIDTAALLKWCADHGWSAEPDSENADPNYKNAPPVRFKKI